MVVEEDDTTREVKRLWSTLSTAMMQIEVSVGSMVSVFGVGEYGPLQSWCFVGHSMNCRTMVAVDQKDGTPHRGECEDEGGNETNGENVQRA